MESKLFELQKIELFNFNITVKITVRFGVRSALGFSFRIRFGLESVYGHLTANFGSVYGQL